jgi:type I restriction enzyme S subunit
MNEINSYTEMKDSGIQWIGSVPSHWRIHTLYQLVTEVKNKNSDLREKNLLSLSYGKIKRKDIDSPDGLLPASFDGYNIIEAGDIVLRLTDLQNDHTSLRVGLATERGIITSAYTTLRPIDEQTSKYLYYLLHAFDLKKGFYGLGSGVRQGLNYNEVKELKVILPTNAEQETIAKFLDNLCCHIDSAITEAKNSIEDYKQWKASEIFEAVTKWDTTTQVRDSGIEWLGQINETWSLMPIKQIVIKRDGGAWGNEPDGTDHDRICMRIADFSFEQGRFKKQDESLYTKRNYSSAQIDKLTLEYGDILVEKSGGGEKTPVGRAVLYDLEYDALYANFMDRIKIDNNIALPEYVSYFWRAMYYRTVTTAYIKQTTGIQNLNISALLEKESIPIPPIKTQKNIVSHLDSLCLRIDEIIDDKQALVADLEQFKRSMICEIVTGKRKVV